MANSNEDLELLEFTFRRDEFKQGEKVYCIDHKRFATVIDKHPFIPDMWIVTLEKGNDKRQQNTSIHKDKIEKCPISLEYQKKNQ